MSSYYDDPDFADEMRRRDEDALDWALTERENEEARREAMRAQRMPTPGQVQGSVPGALRPGASPPPVEAGPADRQPGSPARGAELN